MTDKELDEAIARYDSGDLCNTGGKWNDFAWKAARELQSLRKGEHPEMVLVPREPTEKMIEAGELTDELYHSVASVLDVYKAMIAAARKDGV